MTVAEMKMKKIVIKNCSAEDVENAVKACFAALYHPFLVEDAPLIIMSAHRYAFRQKGKDYGYRRRKV
ncbi:MAG: hypothetical protein JRJ78_16890 [Deltaproteobacteria bacterium]|nr:hypothetical protein [Deltaproteobacteria bacterium]